MYCTKAAWNKDIYTHILQFIKLLLHVHYVQWGFNSSLSYCVTQWLQE